MISGVIVTAANYAQDAENRKAVHEMVESLSRLPLNDLCLVRDQRQEDSFGSPVYVMAFTYKVGGLTVMGVVCPRPGGICGGYCERNNLFPAKSLVDGHRYDISPALVVYLPELVDPVFHSLSSPMSLKGANPQNLGKSFQLEGMDLHDILSFDRNVRRLLITDNYDTVYHEFVHHMDFLRMRDPNQFLRSYVGKGERLVGKTDTDARGMTPMALHYYKSPAEFNAYYQSMVRHLESQPEDEQRELLSEPFNKFARSVMEEAASQGSGWHQMMLRNEGYMDDSNSLLASLGFLTVRNSRDRDVPMTPVFKKFLQRLYMFYREKRRELGMV